MTFAKISMIAKDIEMKRKLDELSGVMMHKMASLAERTVVLARQLAPKRTGYLASSIHVSAVGSDSGPIQSPAVGSSSVNVFKVLNSSKHRQLAAVRQAHQGVRYKVPYTIDFAIKARAGGKLHVQTAGVDAPGGGDTAFGSSGGRIIGLVNDAGKRKNVELLHFQNDPQTARPHIQMPLEHLIGIGTDMPRLEGTLYGQDRSFFLIVVGAYYGAAVEFGYHDIGGHRVPNRRPTPYLRPAMAWAETQLALEAKTGFDDWLRELHG